MKKVFIIANWKSNKTVAQAKDWIDQISNLKSPTSSFEGKEVIVCPSFTLLSEVSQRSREFNEKLEIRIGAQDISIFDEGAYTGEVNGKQIKDFAKFVLVGHSERRKNFSENNEIVSKKLENVLKNEMTPIVCVSNLEEVKILKSNANILKTIVAYEPIFAIGTGVADTPENADKMGKDIKEILGEIPVLYGGSVSKFNIKSFTGMPHIDGALVGRASLDPREFISIVQNA